MYGLFAVCVSAHQRPPICPILCARCKRTISPPTQALSDEGCAVVARSFSRHHQACSNGGRPMVGLFRSCAFLVLLVLAQSSALAQAPSPPLVTVAKPVLK